MDFNEAQDNYPGSYRFPMLKPDAAKSVARLQEEAYNLKCALGADGYVICRTNEFSVSSDFQHMTVSLSSADRLMMHTAAAIEGAIQIHMERSLLPFTWRSDGGKAVTCPFVQELRARTIDVSGVGFPVKLGKTGSGFTLFFGPNLKLPDDRLIELHRLIYQIMRELLELDVREIERRRKLNSQEQQCLQLVADGYKSDAIAKELGLSVNTVNVYLETVVKKFEAANRMQAVAMAIRFGIIS